MLTTQIGLIDQTGIVEISDLAAAAAAFSIQINSPLGTSPASKRSLPIMDEAELAAALGVPFSVTAGAADAKKVE